MKKIVIMQPYYFAWYGFFEQIKLADVYVFLDDAQYVKRSLMSRVDIKTQFGPKWLSIPLEKVHQGDLICDLICYEKNNWREDHLNKLSNAYNKSPYFNLMIKLVEEVFNETDSNLSNVTITAIKKISAFYNLLDSRKFFLASQLDIGGNSTQRLYDISAHFDADVYITGMGALRYMDFELFEKGGVRVEFMNYAKTPYPQINGDFIPYVSILDLIANAGENGTKYMNSNTMRYDEFLGTDIAKEYIRKG